MTNGHEIASKIYESILKRTSINNFIPPCLAIIQLGDHPPSNSYIKIKKTKLAELKWNCKHFRLPSDITNDEFRKTLSSISENEEIDGVIVQLPLPQHITPDHIDLIPYHKDVDGVTVINQGRLFKGYSDYIAPCTALGCIHFLEANKVQIRGSHIAVIGRSILVGRPIAMMLQHRGATVVTLHQEDQDQARLARECGVLISAIGVPHHITPSYIKPGAFVVDIGVTKVDGMILGDVHPSVRQVARFVSPTTGGIGPLTVAYLMSNLLNCRELAQKL